MGSMFVKTGEYTCKVIELMWWTIKLFVTMPEFKGFRFAIWAFLVAWMINPYDSQEVINTKVFSAMLLYYVITRGDR